MDGCSKQGFIELGWECKYRFPSDPINYSIEGSHCEEVCGDNYLTFHECDDGPDKIADYDGCSTLCTIEPGYECLRLAFDIPDRCFEICGDGVKQYELECDDGNQDYKDGCTPDCVFEDGFIC